MRSTPARCLLEAYGELRSFQRKSKLLWSKLLIRLLVLRQRRSYTVLSFLCRSQSRSVRRNAQQRPRSSSTVRCGTIPGRLWHIRSIEDEDDLLRHGGRSSLAPLTREPCCMSDQ